MPICPGCEQSIPYDRLDTHERYCSEIRGDVPEAQSMERLERRLVAMERRLDRQLGELEADLERRLSRIEAARRGGAKYRE